MDNTDTVTAQPPHVLPIDISVTLPSHAIPIDNKGTVLAQPLPITHTYRQFENQLNHNHHPQAKFWLNVVQQGTTKMKFEYIVPTTETSNVIELPKEVVDEGLKFWSSYHLVGFSTHKKLPYKVVQTAVTKLGKSFGLTNTIQGENNTFIFRFKSSIEVDTILSHGPWSLAGHPFSLLKWNQLNQSHPSHLGSLPIWTKFYNIPPNYWTAKGLSYIASAVGEPFYADEATEAITKLKFARICINLNLNKPLKHEIQLKMDDSSFVDIRIEYQWLPKIYGKCRQLNHSDANCPLNYINPTHRKGTTTSPCTKDHSPAIQLVSEWVTVRKKRNKVPQKKKNRNSKFLEPTVEGCNKTIAATVSPTHAKWTTSPYFQPLSSLSDPGCSIQLVNKRNMTARSLKKIARIKENAKPGRLNQPSIQSEIKKLISERKLDIVSIVETKVVKLNVAAIHRFIAPNWPITNNFSFSELGRIWIMWNPSNVNLSVLNCSRQAIHCSISVIGQHTSFFTTFIYAANCANEKQILWDDIIHHSAVFADSPWLLMGDFNAIPNRGEKYGGSKKWSSAMTDFKECFQSAELEDLKFCRILYSWSNKNIGEACIIKKLDRALFLKLGTLTSKELQCSKLSKNSSYLNLS
ncbi:uncharacterized protein LOC132314715 [Cornus florida]|uniref:uncharacterized protein LOC132314715 n=1 Tax=Cornus florida TaxID=4283 RepID=UPI002899C4D1|nr:uncharacterized protein LOC132314715 [Cornus florida]